ncbi:putative transmembrane transport protein [Trypanosoma grayi]|uniref:putative transmembrane transport protein n=1 Tax=Trypanosoma grayi TaxID=71804 RepID=UPI0004F48CF6|nr:putative transmembrane transport protein [Trypanosoma grayi]KEG12466.1 putative transmembrane transport protein [Trypanosoma grayi]
MSAPLNANAQEWRPRDELASFMLPASTCAEEGSASAEGGTTAASAAVADDTSSTKQFPLPMQAEPLMTTEPPAYYPSFTQAGASTDASVDGVLEGVNWTEEFERVMALTKELIERQMDGEMDLTKKVETSQSGFPKQSFNPSIEQTPPRKVPSAPATATVDANKYPPLPGADEVRPLVSGRWVNAATALKPKVNNAHTKNSPGGGETSIDAVGTVSAPAVAAAEPEFDEHGRLLPPLTSKGNRRWKKPTKAQQKREFAQKNAFEAFANALLHSVSPFMAPLRERCKTSLPHIKVDQRFGKSGQPQTAVAQFVVAPLVMNYRPRHFHDLTPGDLMEFHYDFAQVLKQLKSATDIRLGYGPVWKRYAVPFCYVNCREYRQEVLSLCPEEVPNMRAEAMYEDDIVKDITEVVLAVQELEPLQNMSIVQAMSRRVNLAPLFDAFDAIFQPIENYRIIIGDLHRVPSTFLIQTSQLELEQKPSPLVLFNDPRLWYELPLVSRVRVDERSEAGASQHHTADAKGDAETTTKSPLPQSAAANATKHGGLSEAKRGALGTNGTGTEKKPRRRDNSLQSSSSTLAVVAPVVGSVLCFVATAYILWKRQRAKQ